VGGVSRTSPLDLRRLRLTVIAGPSIYLTQRGGSTRSTSEVSPREAPGNHQLQPPECVPVRGPRWVFPGESPVKISGNLYEAYAKGYDCRAAASWVRKMAGKKLPAPPQTADNSDAPDSVPLNGPPRFTCIGRRDANGHAYIGSCRKGKSGVEFGWNSNVANRVAGVVHDASGFGGSDTGIVLTPLDQGRYRLEVQNTSAIGFVNSFTWTPPPGLTITAVTHASGGDCALAPKGNISCTGNLQPPTCLCKGDGGTMTIEFAASGGKETARSVTHGSVGAKVRITAMKPVPYQIPSSPQEARHRGGL